VSATARGMSEPPASRLELVKATIVEAIDRPKQPSEWELIQIVEDRCGVKARWLIRQALQELTGEGQLALFRQPRTTRITREYITSLLESEDLDHALRGTTAPGKQVESTIDALVAGAQRYRHSEAFTEMLDFMANFRDYAPFNNMLVRLQDPTCGFSATASDWKRRFKRQLKDDARPMLILAPKHPVMVVYALDMTDGPPLPDELTRMSRFEGKWNTEWMARTVENAKRDKIAIEIKTLSSSNSGVAQMRYDDREGRRFRIVIHGELDQPSQYGVLCHELAHIYLGHLGTNADGWWPARVNLPVKAVEFEAEAVAFIVTARIGLTGSSAEYLSRYFDGDVVPEGVSLDHVAKTAGLIERMAQQTLPPRPVKKPRGARR
jgi:hypothetical protein